MDSKAGEHLMRLVLLNVVVLLLAAKMVPGKETFRIQNASKEYDLTVEIEKCDEAEQRIMPNTCNGPGRISLYRKRAKTPFQVLNLRSVEVYGDQVAYNQKVNKKPGKPYDDEYSFIFSDFNFDGKEDLAVCNGRGGGYGSPSYNVYLYNSTAQKFIENKRMSQLTEGALGLFLVDQRKKQLVSFSKSGCCYHEAEKYRVVKDQPILVEKIVEDATGDLLVITTSRLINGKWTKSVKRKRAR